MDVYRAVFRHGKNIVRQDAPVGDDDEDIRLQRLYLRKRRTVAHLHRLEHRQTVFQRKLLYRRRAQLHAAALRLVRLGEHADDVELFIYQFFQ